MKAEEKGEEFQRRIFFFWEKTFVRKPGSWYSKDRWRKEQVGLHDKSAARKEGPGTEVLSSKDHGKQFH